MITSASAITLCVLINQGFEEHTIEKLWVCASVCICAYCLIELIRTAKPSGMILFMFLLSSAIDKTEGHQYWRIVFSVLLVATLLSVSFGQANLRREAEAVNPKPVAEEEITYISVGSSGTISD
ncbi:hypothetical protein SLEP1_g59721 [Rubroshorea leprosula]|uniref:Uncharacterized protein n=1 Tax=Rubroshorea leprosula TaxID=152421 RepID=A0AAV5MWE2_9ROSI|nr:hypothetical protein SLEP1_g59721 [Rubroshorea leprosula]